MRRFVNFALTKKTGRQTPNKRFFRFSLIELLIVMSITMILLSVLLPALQRTKKTTQKLQCGNKMKQISTQVFLYCDDFDSSLPIYGKRYAVPIATIKVYWCNYLSYNYFKDEKYYGPTESAPHFQCPVDTTPYYYQGLKNSYGFNAFIMPEVNPGKKTRLHNITYPSQTYMLTDSNWTARHVFGMDPPLCVRLDHNKSTNMIYMDGHMDSIATQPPPLSSDVPWFYN